MKPLFSIVVVALNPGTKLLQTLQSIEMQSCTDYEVVIKDGGSKDSSVEDRQRFLLEKPEFAGRVRFVEKPDNSIYDAMNQAISYAEGRYLYFLNCGDLLTSGQVLEKMKTRMEEERTPENSIFYGDILDALRQETVASNPNIDAFACYRNVPCHQACFYHRKLFEERGYHTKYKVRGDYEHFLWCFFQAKARMYYVPMVIVSYEGGGFSETGENLKRSAAEHKEITALYMTKGQRLKYRLILWVTLAPIRKRMAESRLFSGMYQKLKRLMYGRR